MLAWHACGPRFDLLPPQRREVNGISRSNLCVTLYMQLTLNSWDLRGLLNRTVPFCFDTNDPGSLSSFEDHPSRLFSPGLKIGANEPKARCGLSWRMGVGHVCKEGGPEYSGQPKDGWSHLLHLLSGSFSGVSMPFFCSGCSW